VRGLVHEGRRSPGFIGRPGRIGGRAADAHRILEPVVAVAERNAQLIARARHAVAEPVVHLELQPCRGEEIEASRRLEGVAREQAPADRARAGLEQRRLRVGAGEPERKVAPEARAGRAHGRLREVVEAAIDGAGAQHAGIAPAAMRRARRHRPAGGIVQIVLAQLLAQSKQVEHAHQGRQPVPGNHPVDEPERGAQGA
jgi:hypothetical protein